MDFFTADDLQLLAEQANKPYSAGTAAQRIERDLATGVWAKTKAWGRLLETDDFSSDCRVSVIKRAGTTARQTDGIRRMKRVFRPYSWARLYRPADATRKIFFTVGVDGPSQELVIKLDCMREGSQGLDKRLVARFDEYMQRHAPRAQWTSWRPKDIVNWDWSTLLEKSRQFIADYMPHYDAAVAYTWQGNDPERDKLARVCWNTLGWQRPSGPVGKSTARDSHESSQFAGFGGEEWLFDFGRLIDGYHYGFLQPLNSGINGEAYAGRNFNIRLFTRNEATGDYFLVGRITNAHVLTEEEREVAEAVYRKRGWLEQMQVELEEAGGTGTIDMGMYAAGPFNVRFRPTDVERPETPDGLELIEDIDKLTKSKRYKLFKDLSGENLSLISEGNGKVEVLLKDKQPKTRQNRHRQIQSAQIELAGLHDKVQDLLVGQLRREHPTQRVSDEACIAPYGTRIDVVRELPNKSLVFYEVKVLPTLKACLREALGQLLEYAHWPDNDLSYEWVIVSYHPLSASAANYLNKLRVVYNLPVAYLLIIL